MRLTLPIACAFAVLAIGWMTGAYDHVAAYAAAMQREYQNVLGGAVQSVRQGDPGAMASLILACLGYGFFHAVGPGHGKFLIGGLAASSRAGIGKFVALSVASSLAQAGAAVVLIYGGFALLDLSSGWLLTATERFMTPASYVAIGAIGAWLAYQAIRTLAAHGVDHGHGHEHRHDHRQHHGHDCCGHAHGPTWEEAEAIKSWRQAVPVVLGVAMRPCTGAVLLLVLSWRLQIYLAGVAGVVAMGVGVGAFLSLVASSSVLARRAALWQARIPEAGVALVFAGLRLVAGGSILLIAIYLLSTTAPGSSFAIAS